MTLYEHIKNNAEVEEFTVWDKDYDIETYFYTDILNPKDEWDRGMKTIAQQLDVVDAETDTVTVNLSEVIERNINNGKFEKLFIRNNVNSIMLDIENIFAGYVSESWLTDFANSLK